MYSLQTGRHFVTVHKRHVKSCMPTGCIPLFLACSRSGLGLTYGQSSTSEGWGSFCNRQNIARQRCFVGRTTDVAVAMTRFF